MGKFAKIIVNIHHCFKCRYFTEKKKTVVTMEGL